MITDEKELKRLLWKTIIAAVGDVGDHIRPGEDEILCDTEAMAEGVADLLEALGFSYVRTGYYDPVEDERNGEVDDYTGWWYVDWD